MVLILVLMEVGLEGSKLWCRMERNQGLNPCFNGSWSRRAFLLNHMNINMLMNLISQILTGFCRKCEIFLALLTFALQKYKKITLCASFNTRKSYKVTNWHDSC